MVPWLRENRLPARSTDYNGSSMVASAKVVFFDVDGVLVDSLPEHLQICRDKAREFGLQLEIPSVDQFRAMVSRGIKVSPMSEFFRSVGFPEAYIERAVADYERDFMQRYKPRKFSGVDEMLENLRTASLQLGLVTSNARGNVEPALGTAMRHFDPRAVFFFEHGAESRSKSAALVEGARRLGASTLACVYVGDQPADAEAAASAEVRFLGVTYGWGITRGDSRFDTVDAPAQIVQRLASAQLPTK